MADDFTHALGDRQEARLAAALGYLGQPGLSGGDAAAPGARSGAAAAANEGQLHRSPWRENRILRR